MGDDKSIAEIIKEGEEIRAEIVHLIQTDDDAFGFVLWAIGKSARIISKDIENGRDDEVTQIYRRFITKFYDPGVLH